VISSIVHWRYYKTDLSSDFWALTSFLDTMSARWSSHTHARSGNLAAKYCDQLRGLYHKCQNDESFKMDVLGYSNEIKWNGRGSETDQDVPQHGDTGFDHSQGPGTSPFGVAYISSTKMIQQLPQTRSIRSLFQPSNLVVVFLVWSMLRRSQRYSTPGLDPRATIQAVQTS
jgi:hypothetical protein